MSFFLLTMKVQTAVVFGFLHLDDLVKCGSHLEIIYVPFKELVYK